MSGYFYYSDKSYCELKRKNLAAFESGLLRISGRPQRFHGTIRLPASKSYLHRALFISSLAEGKSSIVNCGVDINEDIEATVGALTSLGASIERQSTGGGTFLVYPCASPVFENMELNAAGSGTTARFLIPYCALTPPGTKVTIRGNESLTKRPMEAVFESLSELGVKARSLEEDGRLPISVEGGGIEGGECQVDGSVSSQFLSSLLIACVKAKKDTLVAIKNPDKQVSTPYIEATLRSLAAFGFKVSSERSQFGRYVSFRIRAGQTPKGRKFSVPGDMSSAAALIAAAISARGHVRLTNVGPKSLPQADSAIVPIARRLGARISTPTRNGLSIGYVDPKKTGRSFSIDLGNSPDLVPTVAGLAAATESQFVISNIEHLHFKESDRISVLSRELSRIGVETKALDSELVVLGSKRRELEEKAIIDPEKDHRMLMALTIAALSGRFGTVYIKNPECVRKSYPAFITDLQRLCGEKSTVKIVQQIAKAVQQ